MRRFRRFRRFRGRRPLVRAQRPVWRQAFDFAIDDDPLGRRSPTKQLQGNASDTLNFPPITSSAGERYIILNTDGGGGASGAHIVCGRTELDFFEGELSVLRMMGRLRLHMVHVTDAAGNFASRQVEVRAWMYKTFEQDLNNRIGLIHPFNGADWDVRVLWSATWLAKVQQGTQIQPVAEFGETHINFGALSDYETVSGEDAHVRRIGLKSAVKLKGNERIALVFGIGPLPSDNLVTFATFSGYLRMLIKH